MVDDFELVADEVDYPPARPQARTVPGLFRPRHDQAHQLTALSSRQLWRSAGCRARTQAATAPPAIRPLPTAYGAPIHTQALGHDMHGDLSLEQFDRT